MPNANGHGELVHRGEVRPGTCHHPHRHRRALPSLGPPVRATLGAGAPVIATEGKCSSNSFDLPGHAPRRPSCTPPWVAPLGTSSPTLSHSQCPPVAAVTGYALALAHDVVDMRGFRGFLYMS
uniref:Uncharacterized protein n=1 Tax=Oryza punctata TaxID=4537 RepID=A0A0E0LSE9_ORYPU